MGNRIVSEDVNTGQCAATVRHTMDGWDEISSSQLPISTLIHKYNQEQDRKRPSHQYHQPKSPSVLCSSLLVDPYLRFPDDLNDKRYRLYPHGRLQSRQQRQLCGRQAYQQITHEQTHLNSNQAGDTRTQIQRASTLPLQDEERFLTRKATVRVWL